MGKTVAYGRLSSIEQAETNALAQQMSRLKKAGADEFFVDIETGDSTTRKNFNRMLSLVQSGEVSRVIGTRIDRLTRNPKEYLDLKEIIRESGATLCLLDQGGDVDLSNSSGELQMDLNAVFSTHERRMLRERVIKGYAYRRERLAACQRAPWAYVTQDEEYCLNEKPCVCLLESRPANYLDLYNVPDDSPELLSLSKSAIARKAIELLLQIKKPRQVLRELYRTYGVPKKVVPIQRKDYFAERDALTGGDVEYWGANPVLHEELLFWGMNSSFVDWLRNPVLRGHTGFLKYEKNKMHKPVEEWEVHYNTHLDQRLLSDQDFAEIEAILAANSRKIGTPDAVFYLSGLVWCPQCNSKCVLKKSTDYRYYGCRNSGVRCENRSCVRTEKIDAAIAQRLFEAAIAFQQKVDLPIAEISEPAEMTAMRQQLEEVERLLALSPNFILTQARDGLHQQIETQSRANPQQSFLGATAQEILSHRHAKNLAFWYMLTQQEREAVYDKSIKRVEILHGEVTSIDLHIDGV